MVVFISPGLENESLLLVVSSNMWSAYLRRKHFAIKNVAKNAVPCFTLIQKNHLLASPIITRVLDKHCSINYSK